MAIETAGAGLEKALRVEALPGAVVGDAKARGLVGVALPVGRYTGRRVLLVVPDHTRTAPVGMMFKAIFDQIGGVAKALDVMIALGTHPPMEESAIQKRLELTSAERSGGYGKVKFLNHAWDDPSELREIGRIPAGDIRELSGGLFEMEVRVEINRHALEYDELIVVGPVFPHEVVGFSGGNKYFFPGISGPDLLNFFHWLGAVVTNPKIIGTKWTPVRKVVDRAAALIPVERRCFAMVVEGTGLAGLYFGTPEAAWDAASDMSDRRHIIYKDRPFHTILSCAPPMYDELWVGGKCMYKLEPVLADGGELIIYAPHIHEISVTHGRLIEEIGYHCRDYFLKQWDKFKGYPWGVVAHSTHVRGIGEYDAVAGIERCRAKVTLATGIPEATCRKINMGYRDPASIRQEDYAGREGEGVLLVPKAGEMLYRLKSPPTWAKG
ncbi:MAG TPA: lactate racemase domain-containing protein [Verrucomicrobiae bacterium]|nr:lactate racemase domain-containing protein [Verrucomicrobiae bacterium]